MRMGLEQRIGMVARAWRGGMTGMALAGALIGGGMLLAPSAGRADEVAKTFTVTGHARVRVQTDDGSVRVSTGDIKQVEIRVEYTGYKLDRDLQVSTSQNGDSVEVIAKTHGGNWFNFGVRHSSLRVEVHMPKDADLEVSSGDGSVEADSINGNLDVRTGDGHISVQGAKGNIRLRTGDGHIEGRALDGRADITTGDGHVNVEGRFDSLNIKTGDGSVTARAGKGSTVSAPWNIHTGDGSVDLDLPGEMQANLDASTHDGRISLGIPVTVEGTFSTTKIMGKMNGGGQAIVVRTGDGSIHLNKS
jgi:Putative adhesin